MATLRPMSLADLDEVYALECVLFGASVLTLICQTPKNKTHSSTLAWKIPWTEELGGLPSLRPRHD